MMFVTNFNLLQALDEIFVKNNLHEAASEPHQ